MIPNPPVPNVELMVTVNQINVVLDGIQVDKVDYEIVKTEYGLQFKTKSQPKKDNWYVRDSDLYINSNRMLFDMGIAQDGPGYEYSKVN